MRSHAQEIASRSGLDLTAVVDAKKPFTHPVHMCSPFADSLGFCDSVSSEGLVGVYCMRDFGLLVVTPRRSNRLVGS